MCTHQIWQPADPNDADQIRIELAQSNVDIIKSVMPKVAELEQLKNSAKVLKETIKTLTF